MKQPISRILAKIDAALRSPDAAAGVSNPKAVKRAKDALDNLARMHGYQLTGVELNEAVRAVARALGVAQAATDPLKQPQYIIEGIILRRLHEKRIEGYTIETAKEIAEALALPSTNGDTP